MQLRCLSTEHKRSTRTQWGWIQVRYRSKNRQKSSCQATYNSELSTFTVNHKENKNRRL